MRWRDRRYPVRLAGASFNGTQSFAMEFFRLAGNGCRQTLGKRLATATISAQHAGKLSLFEIATHHAAIEDFVQRIQLEGLPTDVDCVAESALLLEMPAERTDQTFEFCLQSHSWRQHPRFFRFSREKMPRIKRKGRAQIRLRAPDRSGIAEALQATVCEALKIPDIHPAKLRIECQFAVVLKQGAARPQ